MQEKEQNKIFIKKRSIKMFKFGSFSQRVSLKRLLVCFVALFGFVSLSIASDNERERESN